MKRNALVKTMAVMAAIAVALFVAMGMTGCSGGSTSGGKSATVNGHSVTEYNSDVDNLARILNEAKSLNHKIEGMVNPNNFTSQTQVDEYNSYVDQYNRVSTQYNNAAKAFSSKYGSTIDGAGTRPTDPDNIDLPRKK